MRTESGEIDAQDTKHSFWGTVGAAVAGLAKRAGCSADHCPLPEVREAARDLREWDSSADEQPLAV